MKPSVRKYVLLLALLLQAAAGTAAELRQLDIRVELRPNGDARITETRRMAIDSNGTECYIVVGNLNGSTVSQFSVTDETGRTYDNATPWDTGASRQRKAGRCGIVEKKDGYELCWGLGDSGERTYTATYTLSRLLRGYADADGFNYMFVAHDVKPSPQQATLTIVRADGQPFSAQETGIWAFRFQGEVQLEDGAIVARTTQPMTGENAMIVMVRSEKGVFSPSSSSSESFETMKARALEGSDYSTQQSAGLMEKAKDGLAIGFAALIILLPFALLFWLWYRVYAERRRVKKDLLWYRAIPMNGNLHRAHQAMNALKWSELSYKNLLSAVVMRLINIGALDIVQQTDKRGRLQNFIAVTDSPMLQRQTSLVRQLHNFCLQAAGDDRILEPKELKRWMKRNTPQVEGFVAMLHQKMSLGECKQQREEVRKLFGLKKYLEEFTLTNERSINEVQLWNEYLVYATLFGNASQVMKDMQRINPEFFRLNTIAQKMSEEEVLPLISAAVFQSTRQADRRITASKEREAGGGGAASLGGGGGFSGGGSGGGIR